MPIEFTFSEYLTYSSPNQHSVLINQNLLDDNFLLMAVMEFENASRIIVKCNFFFRLST